MRVAPGALLLAGFALLGFSALAFHGRSALDGAWRLVESSWGAYAMTAAGKAADGAGAEVSLRRTSAVHDGVGSVVAALPADALRGRRVRLSADLRAEDVTSDGSLYGGASLWLRVESASRTLLLDETSDRPVEGSTGWVRRELTVPVDPTATHVSFGLRLAGGGLVAARRLRLERLDALDPAAPIAPAAARDLDSALALARAYSLWRDTVSWAVVAPRVRALAAGAATPEDAYPAIRALLTALGDRHSLLLTPRGVARYESGVESRPPEVRMLERGIGYVLVPTHMNREAAAMRRFAAALHAGLREHGPAAGCGWVIDLRQNGGGNMGPMLAGVQPFLGRDTVGRWMAPTPAGTWTRQGAGFTAADYLALVGLPPPADLAGLDSAYVAVLTGPWTGSSGEVVASAFRGRPRTRSFGQPTAGVSTGNEGYSLPSGASLVLTVAVLADRTGRRFGGAIAPDEELADGPGADRALDAARAWLARHRPCSATRDAR